MRSPRIDLGDRLQHLSHPGRASLGDAARRLGVPEGWVAESLATSGGTLPGGGTRVMRLTTAHPDSLLTTLTTGGPVLVGVGDHDIGGWRLAHALSVSVEPPVLRMRWDQAELVLPATDLHAYAVIESTGCRCDERRSIVWYDAVGHGLARITACVGNDLAAYATCIVRHAQALPATWVDPSPSSLPVSEFPRRMLPAGILGRIFTNLSRAADLPPVTIVLGHERSQLVQHASSWMDRSSGCTIALSDGVGCVHIRQDAVAGVAIVPISAPGPQHTVETYDLTGQRCLAIMPEQAADGCDPPAWAALIAAWQGGAS